MVANGITKYAQNIVLIYGIIMDRYKVPLEIFIVRIKYFVFVLFYMKQGKMCACVTYIEIDPNFMGKF